MKTPCQQQGLLFRLKTRHVADSARRREKRHEARVETITLLPLVSTDGPIGHPLHAPVGIRFQFPGAGAV
jgi:hypothetical protein